MAKQLHRIRDMGAKQARLTDEQRLNIRTRVRGGNRQSIGQWETVKAEVVRDQQRESMRVQG
jgi:hypothetical protein